MPGARPRCYVASPLGFTEAGRAWNRDVLLPALAAVVEPLDPWAATTAQDIEHARDGGRLRELWLDIARRNAELIDGADLLVAVLDGPDPDSGTSAEIGYAAARGISVLALRTDLRQAGEPEMAVNLQVEYFATSGGVPVSRTLEELVGALAARFGPDARCSPP